MVRLVLLGRVLAGLVGMTVSAQAGTRAWVSSAGTDSGGCPQSAPCKSLQYAYDQVTAGGEIDIKDAGNYAPLTIEKSVSIIAGEGVTATIAVPAGGIGIKIAAGSNDAVALRGLTINGFSRTTSGQQTGVQVTSGVSVAIDHCAFIGSFWGLIIDAPRSYVEITNSYFFDNEFGIDNRNAAFAALGRSVITGNRAGLYLSSNTLYSYGDNDINANLTYDIYGSLNHGGTQ